MIRIYYHVYGIDNVDEIVDEQLSLLNAKLAHLRELVELCIWNSGPRKLLLRNAPKGEKLGR
jgi:hypothetical protein